ncbi:LptA/OstA family protein [Cochlodiniinecator piscidefendens]|uniref:LptA/OstA family protein n=1 Tax=Cochlodiniinecator piscidefendens TaxID=2715756 RepID=UPI0014085070|nr:LptA/OstA family protein [Cochlodiniinecator piscidefendens]
MKNILAFALILCASVHFSSPVLAQGAQVAFGGLQHDASLPVEVTADQLSVDQSDGSAVFSGNVVVGQGSLRLSAGSIRVEYAAGDAQNTGQISKLHASGGVTIVNGAEAAEAEQAVYTIGSSTIVMTGNVLLTQGQNALSANSMVIDLTSGTARMEGRVQTILQSGGNN